eukprot:s1002_g3.t1
MKCGGCFAFWSRTISGSSKDCRGPVEIPHYVPPRYAVKAQAEEETPFQLTCEASSMWRPETQPWDRSVPWDGRPIEIDPVTNRPVKVKAKPTTAEIGVQTEPVHIEPIQTEPPKEAEDSDSGIDLKRLCAAIAHFQEVHEREHKHLETTSEEPQELQELQAEAVKTDEAVEMLESPQPVTYEKSFMEEAQEKAERALSLKAFWEKIAQHRRMTQQLARGETPTPDPRWLPRRPRPPKMKKKHDNWEDYIREFDDPETVDLEGLWIPVEPYELPKGTPILTVEVNLGGEEFPLGPLEYTTENTVEEACHDFVAEHNLRPIFEPLLQAYVCYTVMNCIEQTSLDVLTLL